MPQLISLVVHDPGRVEAVVEEWVEAEVPGMTLLDSSGLAAQLAATEIRDDLPLMPSLRSVLRGRETRSRLIFSVVPDGFDVDDLVRRTEGVLGPLDEEESGIFFVVPVARVEGLRAQSSHST